MLLAVMARIVSGQDQAATVCNGALHAVDQIARIDARRREGLYRHGKLLPHEPHAAYRIDGADNADGHNAVLVKRLMNGSGNIAAGHRNLHNGNQRVALLEAGRRAAAGDDHIGVVVPRNDCFRLNSTVHRIAQIAAFSKYLLMQRPCLVNHLDQLQIRHNECDIGHERHLIAL